MNNLRRLTGIAVLGLSLGCPRDVVQVSGTVRAAETLQPITGASVKWLGETVVTGDNGRYQFEVKRGVYTLDVSFQDISIKRIVGITNPIGYQRDKQTQDILLPSGPVEQNVWIVALHDYAVSNEQYKNPEFSSVFIADALGNNGQFLDVETTFVRRTLWDPKHKLLYFSGGYLHRHNIESQTTEDVSCTGLPDEQTEFMCLSPDGETALVKTQSRLFLLTSLSDACEAVEVSEYQGDLHCTIDRNNIMSISSTDEGEPWFARVDLNQSPLEWEPFSLKDGEFLDYPVALNNNELLLERTPPPSLENGDPEIWQVNPDSAEAEFLSVGTAPFGRIGNQLYYTATARVNEPFGIRMKDLDKGVDVMFFNAAASAANLRHWE